MAEQDIGALTTGMLKVSVSAGVATPISLGAGTMTSGTADVYPGTDGTNTGTVVHHFELIISGNTQTMTFKAPKGTPTAGDVMFIDIYTTGSGNIVDMTAYTVLGVTAPTAITASKHTIAGLKYIGTTWFIVATGQQA